MTAGRRRCARTAAAQGDELLEPARHRGRTHVAVTPVSTTAWPVGAAGSSNRRGQDQAAYIKRLADGTTPYIEEIGRAGKRLAPASTRRLIGTIDATRLAAPPHPHARNASRGSLDIVDVPPGGEAVDLDLWPGEER